MDPCSSLAELGRWARSELVLQDILDQSLRDTIDEIYLPGPAVGQLRHLCARLGARTLRQVLEHPRADSMLAALGGASRSPSVVQSLFDALVDAGDLEDDVGDIVARDDWPVAIHNARPPVVEPAPLQLPALRQWAKKHGVEDRLGDPAKVLVPVLHYGGAELVATLHGDKTLADVFAAPPAAAPKSARPVPRWRRDMHAQAERALRVAAGQYLHDTAVIRATVLARRARTKQAEPPSGPPLAELHSRLQQARATIAAVVKERPIGTYFPQPATLEVDPLRIAYVESADFRWGMRQVSALIAVEEDPINVRCVCPESARGPCAHALSALDEALDFVRVPSPQRDRLASILATPPWERFLRAFGEELGRRAPAPAADDQRLAWRITGDASQVELEPVIQKRLKGGGFSQGQRVRLEDLAAHRRHFTDPRDARAVDALTAGFEETRSWPRGAIARARLARALEALAGHPLVFVPGASSNPARITHERMSVALEPVDGAVCVAFFIGQERYDAATLAALAGEDGPVIVVDRAAGSVLLCAIDERATALLDAFAKHPARFPEEIHDELLRALGALQESVDLRLPEALAGTPVEADARPVVRLAPRDNGDVEVELVVRPVEGGPVFRPGEGATTVLHAIDGRRVAARRDLAKETAASAALAARLPPASGEAAPWTHLLDEQAALDLLIEVRDLGDAVVVEWLEPDKRLVLTSTAKAKELRVRVTDRRDWFGVEGEVEVDGHALPLAVLLDAVRSGRRYVRVAPGKFAALEDDLRRRVQQAGDVLHAGRKGLEVALPGVELLSEIVEDPQRLEAAARFRGIVRRLAESRHLDPALPAGLTAELRPYQVEGYKWLMRLAAWGAGACLADDMGLGKTVQALAMLLARADTGPALVVAPTSVGQNWLDEAARFAPSLRARLYRGPARGSLLAEARPGDLLVTSYALVVRDAEALAETRFATLILDEAQAIKNALTRRARAVAGVDAELRVALTGTPVENHLGDLWSLMRVLTPGLLGSWDHFRDRFATPIERARDPERRAALARVLRPFLLRRTKDEVAPELPPRIEIQRVVEPSAAERALYDLARRAALEALAAGEGDARFAILAALTRLRRLACHPRLVDPASSVPSSKLATFLEIVDELRDEGHRALVFSQFTTHLALVREALDRRGITYDYLDGSTPAEERARRVAGFQTGRSDLFLISLKAGGSGLNLTAADYVIHLDPWWNPAVEDQATDRAHRIGQTRAVTVIRLVTRGTIEEGVLALHGDKRALAASVFDESGSPARLSTDELAALIRGGIDEAQGDDESDAAGDEVVSEREPAPPPPRPQPLRLPPPPPPVAAPSTVVAPPTMATVVAASPPPVAAPLPPPEAPVPAPAPPVATAKSANGAPPAGDLVARVIDYLAEQRGGIDPRYDATLRGYERGLRRFVEYLASRPGSGATDEVIDDFLGAVYEERWAVPASQKAATRAAMNHLRAYLRVVKG